MSKVLPFKRPHAKSFGQVHVFHSSCGRLEVMHESASGESWATLGHFEREDREIAVRKALSALSDYPGARLGVVVQ